MRDDEHDGAGATQTRRVLVVDDDRDVADAIAAMLGDGFEAETAGTLASAMTLLDATVFDAVVLDLDLPETTGVPTLQAVRTSAPLVPVIVVSGWAPEEFGARVFRAGGYDYLTKGAFGEEDLVGAVERGIERQAELLAHHDAATQVRNKLKEEFSFAGFDPVASTTAQSYGAARVRAIAPGVFDGLVGRFVDALRAALEERAFKQERTVGVLLRSLASDMMQLRVGPRDVIDVYTEAVRRESNGANPRRARAVVEEGRVLVLELMGHVVASYRTLVVVDPLAIAAVSPEWRKEDDE